jgi:hypothetical protein
MGIMYIALCTLSLRGNPILIPKSKVVFFLPKKTKKNKKQKRINMFIVFLFFFPEKSFEMKFFLLGTFATLIRP